METSSDSVSDIHVSVGLMCRGQPFASYARVLSTMKGRELEMRDAARVAMKHPLWTVAEDVEGLDFVLQTAG